MADMTPQERALLQQEIQQRQALLNIIKAESGVSADLVKQMEDLLDASKDATQSYENELKRKRSWFKAEDDVSKAKLEAAKRANQTEAQLNAALKGQKEQREALEAKILKNKQQINENEQRNAELTERLNAILSEEKKQEIQDQIYRNNRKQKLMAEENDQIRNELISRDHNEKQLTQAIKAAAENRKQAEQAYVKESFGSATGRKVKDKILSLFDTGLMTKAAMQTWDATKAAMATGAGVAFKDVFTAAKLGLNPKEYIELQAAHRRTILAAGGVAENFRILEVGQQKYFKNIGDLAQTTKFTEEQMTLLGTAGIRPTLTNMDLLASGFSQLQTLTGITGEQFTSTMRDIITDETTIARLRAARSEQERKLIVSGIKQRAIENAARGMSIEQIKETTKALNKMAGASPLDRIKQAARFRAFAGALGIQGGNEAASIMVKGKRASSEEQARLQEIMANASNTLERTATGSLGAEIFATTLADKLDLKPTLDSFNTSLNDALKPLPGSVNTLNKTVQEFGDYIKQAMQLSSGVTNNPAILGSVGALGYGIRAMRNRGGGSGSGWMSSMFGKTGAGPSAGTAAAANASKASTALVTLGKMAKILGPIAAVGGGVYEGYQKYKDTGNKGRAVGTGVGSASGALAGAIAGQALIPIPVVGALIGGAVGAWAGGHIGDTIGEKISGSNTSPDTSEDQTDYYDNMSSSISAQLKKMDESNNWLKQMSEQLADLTEQTTQQNAYLSSIMDLNDNQLAELRKKQETHRVATSGRMQAAERKYGYNSEPSTIRG